MSATILTKHIYSGSCSEDEKT